MQSKVRLLSAGAIGNILEWFDFAIYGYFASYIAASFFPSADPLSSLLAAYGAFAAGYLARPVGAVIFGHIGDSLGRKTVLKISLTMMGICTFCIGLVPGYDQIGASAGVILVLLRIAQGISIGGEYTGSMVFVAEHAPDDRRGVFTSTCSMGSVFGFLLGSAAAALLSNIFTAAEIATGIWRFAFIGSGGIMLVGLFLRRSIKDAQPIQTTAPAEPRHPPVLTAIRSNWPDIMRIAGLALSVNVGFYVILVFLVTYLTDQQNVPSPEALSINTMALVTSIIAMPIGGYISDLFGRRPTLLAFNFLLVLSSYPLYQLILQDQEWMIITGQICIALILGLAGGVNPATMAEIPESSVRVSVVSVGYNVAVAIFAGTAPAVAAFLIQRTGYGTAPAFYIMLFGALAFLTALTLQETRHKSLTR